MQIDKEDFIFCRYNNEMQAVRDSSTTADIAHVEERPKTTTTTSFKIYDQNLKQPSVESQQPFAYTGTSKI
jgi:hypothetical protein